MGVSEEKGRIAVPNVIRTVPNPFRRNVAVAWNPSQSSGGIARVYTQDGIRVRQAQVQPGASRWVWDGRDEAGVSLPLGVYVVEIGQGMRAKVVITR